MTNPQLLDALKALYEFVRLLPDSYSESAAWQSLEFERVLRDTKAVLDTAGDPS